jgi:hypothetical protein
LDLVFCCYFPSLLYWLPTPNNYRIIARSGYWKYDHECRKTHQIKRVCGTCYAHKFNLNVFQNFIETLLETIFSSSSRETPNRILPNLAHLLILCVFTSDLCGVNTEVKEVPHTRLIWCVLRHSWSYFQYPLRAIIL